MQGAYSETPALAKAAISLKCGIWLREQDSNLRPGG